MNFNLIDKDLSPYQINTVHPNDQELGNYIRQHKPKHIYSDIYLNDQDLGREFRRLMLRHEGQTLQSLLVEASQNGIKLTELAERIKNMIK